MIAQPLISVCIPTYNRGPVFDYTIESVLGQTYPHLELIISDDASPFNIHERLARYAVDPRLRIVKQPKNLGIVRNFNAVLSLAKGQIIKPLCDDDALHPQALEFLVKEMGDAEFVVLRDLLLHGDKRPEFERVTRVEVERHPAELTDETLRVDAISPTNIAFTADLWQRLGPYDEQIGFAFDYDFTVQAKATCHYVYIKTPMCIFRNWPGSTTTKNTNPYITYPDFKQTIERLWSRYPTNRRVLARRVRHVMLTQGYNFLRRAMTANFKYSSIYMDVSMRLLRYAS